MKLPEELVEEWLINYGTTKEVVPGESYLSMHMRGLKVAYLAGYNADRWISVEDELPEEGKFVLGWDGIHVWECQWYYDREDSRLEDDPFIVPRKAWFTTIPYQDENGGMVKEFDCLSTINHWQPLPTPPAKK